MTEHTHITVGRIAIGALLVAVVLTAGAVGTAAAEPMDGKGNDPYPPPLYESLDGKGNDVVYAFPINNVTILGSRMVPTEQRSTIPNSLPDGLSVPDDAYVALAWSQDMDPY